MSSEEDLNEMVQKLADEWGDCYITVRNSEYSLSDVFISNTTDEGLPAGRKSKKIEGETLSEAVEKAYEEVNTNR